MTSPARLLSVALTVCCTCPGAVRLDAAGGGDDRDWKRLPGVGFSVMGNASESDLRKVRQEIQLFRDAMASLFPSLRVDGPMPLEVVVFKDDRAFTPFKPRARGKPIDDVAGYFTSRADRTLIVLAPASGEFAYQLIFHEYTHFIVHLNMRSVPLWFNEGLAEFYSTFRGSSVDNRSQIGRPVADRVRVLNGLTLLPVKRLLSPDQQDLFRDPWATALFYSQSWAFVHYLLLGDNGAHRAQLSAFLARPNAGETLDARFARAFGAPFEQVDREFAAYVRRFSWPVAEVRPMRAEAAPAVFERLPPIEALQAQADLLVSHGALDEADALLDKASAIDPAHPAVRLARAKSLIARERPGEALTVLGPAADAGAAFAAELTRGDAHRLLEQYEDAAAAYTRALARRSESAAAYFGLSVSYLGLDRDDQAASAFERCLAVDPSPTWYSARIFTALRMGIDSNVVSDASGYLREASPDAGQRAYVALAAALTLMRRNQRDESNRVLDTALQSLEPKAWTAAVVNFVRGRMTAADLLKRASGAGETTEAHAYVGVLASIDGKPDDARPHLQWVMDKGLKSYVEYGYAVGELKRLAHAQSTEKAR